MGGQQTPHRKRNEIMLELIHALQIVTTLAMAPQAPQEPISVHKATEVQIVTESVTARRVGARIVGRTVLAVSVVEVAQ